MVIKEWEKIKFDDLKRNRLQIFSSKKIRVQDGNKKCIIGIEKYMVKLNQTLTLWLQIQTYWSVKNWTNKKN
jgi:hypothetical protein